jgi:hypothetical protein
MGTGLSKRPHGCNLLRVGGVVTGIGQEEATQHSSSGETT